MKRYIVLLLFMLSVVVKGLAGRPFTFDDVFSSKFRANMQRSVTALPDGNHYACIEKNGNIVTYKYKNGKQAEVLFSPEGAKGERISDVEDFILSPDGKRLLLATNVNHIYRHSYTAEWYVYDLKTKQILRLSANGSQQIPVWSNDGGKIAFVRTNNIYVVEIGQTADGIGVLSEDQVTADGKFNEIINGIPDWVNEEEFGFNCAMCFNADGSKICWLRYDESAVKTYALQLFGGMQPEKKAYKDYPGEYAYKYPKAGQQNATMSAWCYDIKDKKTQQLALPLDVDGYVCRILSTPDANSILLVTLNRRQNDMRIYSANPVTSECSLIMQETAEKYIPEVTYCNIVQTDKHLLLISDRDGYRHIYMYDLKGELIRAVCPKNVDVTDVYGIDEKTGDIFYQAAPTPMTRHIYVAHKDGQIEQLSVNEGQNSAVFSSTFAYYFNTWSDRNTPYVCTSCDRKGRVLSTLIDNKELRERIAEYDMPDKELFSFTTTDGILLNGWMMKPVDFDPSRKYPVIMHQYSGPASQKVSDSWALGSMGAGAIYDAYLCSLGFIVVTVDGRGTGGRGADFEKCTYMRLGELESRDQVETAVWLGRQSYVDKEHIGIWGWSFGGFNTLMAMSEGRPVFYAGVAIAPPTNWKYYDTIYTERFMRTPQENPDGYNVNPIERVKNLSGRLLLCHGLADDNVHPQNSFEYSEALVQADKDFRELIYTNRNHSIYGGNTRKHLLRQVVNHFVESLNK